MPCDSQLKPRQTLAERALEVTKALRLLEAKLQAGQTRVVIGQNGALAFAGWTADRDGVSDVCAYRALAAKDSWALRQAISRAEAQSGRKLNPQAVGAGVHSHDAGRSWNSGH
jgi:hypothetical protein